MGCIGHSQKHTKLSYIHLALYNMSHLIWNHVYSCHHRGEINNVHYSQSTLFLIDRNLRSEEHFKATENEAACPEGITGYPPLQGSI